MKRMNSQKGFTIIELVVVILLLGILTATALPRFMDVTDDAHDSVVSATIASLNTGGALYHAQWVASGEPDSLSEFGNLDSNSVGYPIGLTTTTIDSNQDCIDVFQNLLQSGGQATITALTAATNVAFTATTAFSTAASDFVTRNVSPSTCYYAYTAQFQQGAAGANTPVFTYAAGTGVFSSTTDM